MPRPNNSSNDLEILDLLIAGKSEGVRRLLEENGDRVRSYLKRKFRDELDHWQIEEAMSMAAVRAWQSASRFDPTRGSLRAWYAVVARNCALSLIAQHRDDPFVPIDGIDPTILGVASGHQEARRMQLVVEVHRALANLSPLQRSVLRADLNAGTTLPAPVLAERLRSTTASIYVARTTGRRRMRKEMERLGYHDGIGSRKAPSEGKSTTSQEPSDRSESGRSESGRPESDRPRAEPRDDAAPDGPSRPPREGKA